MIKRTTLLRLVTAIACSCMMTSQASAYVYWTGKIDHIFFSQVGNEPFRVYPDPSNTMTGCPSPGNFGYVDTSNGNYQVFVASLMSAYMAGKTVTLTMQPDANGWCQIIEGGTAN